MVASLDRHERGPVPQLRHHLGEERRSRERVARSSTNSIGTAIAQVLGAQALGPPGGWRG